MGALGLMERKGSHWPRLVGVEIDPWLRPENCDLEYWLKEVTQGMLVGLRCGHAPELAVPEHMLEPGPLRSAMLSEFAYRHVAEELATRAITYMVRHAPTLETMDFYATQLLDEARHAAVFRGHLIELGLPKDRIVQTIDEIVGKTRQTVLERLERFALEVLEAGDFIGEVLVLTVIAEGVLAPAAEMSEYKWQVFDPLASQICLGVNIDETRHLAVGTAIIRQHLLERPEERGRAQEIVNRGLALVSSLPMLDILIERETLFQKGLEQHRGLLDGCQLVPGRRLADTTAEERLLLQESWCSQVQADRLRYMGLEPPRA